MTQNFDKQVYALSVIRRGEHFPPQDSLGYFKKKLDLKLLNYIALLLVTKDKGDVAAVTVEHLPHALNFYYSKNSPCPPQLGEYIQRLITLCASVEAESFIGSFFTEVTRSCRPKLKNRLAKCKRAIRSLGDIEFTGEVAAQEPYTAMHMDEYSGKSFGEVAQNFLKQLMDYEIEPHKGGSARGTFELCVDAYCIGQEQGLKEYPLLVTRIQKLGDYFGAVRRIHGLLTAPALKRLQTSISFIEIKPSQPRVVQISESTLKILNDNARVHDLDDIDAVEYKKRFSQPVQENDKPQPITVSSHCELTLALHFYEKMTGKQHSMEMGVSKGCCWMCENFLDTIAQPKRERRLVVAVSHNQGKVHAGWGMPDKTPSDVAEKMIDNVTTSLLKLQQDVIDRRVSDSHPAGSSPLGPSGLDQPVRRNWKKYSPK